MTVDVEVPAAAPAAPAITRRAVNKVKRLHHHAIRTTDMAATRRFYEDIIGLPLVGTWVETIDPQTGEPSNYVHCFFELGDGSALAFFQFQEGMRGDGADLPTNPFEHHIAVTAATVSDVDAFDAALRAAGYPTQVIDHGYCYSVYTTDPNGMNLEIAADVDDAETIYATAAQTARRDMEAWLEGIRTGNNAWRGKPNA